MNRALLVVLLLAACREETAAIPDPVPLTEEAVGHYCQMELLEHPGGGHEVALVRMNGPPEHEPRAFSVILPGRVEMIRASEPLLELHLTGGARRERVDLRPILPLVVVR